MQTRKQRTLRVLFLLYILCLLWILFARSRYVPGVPYWDQVRQYLNLKPFHTIRLYSRLLADPVRPILTRLAVYNLAGNVLLFVPMGFFLPLLFDKLGKLWKVLLFTACITSAAEIVQVLILAGSCDVDDLILNLTGTLLGYPLHKYFKS